MFEEPKQVTDGMRQGLARMYADPFVRDYLHNAIAISKHNTVVLVGKGKYEEARDYASRAKALEQLVEKGKEYFAHFEKVNKSLVEPLRELQVEEVQL